MLSPLAQSMATVLTVDVAAVAVTPARRPAAAGPRSMP